MIELLFREDYAAYFILFLFAAGTIGKLVIGISLSSTIKQSENMNVTRKNLLKQIKLKYENCYRLNLQINNVSAFVCKYIYKYRIWGIPLKSFNNVANICILLCMPAGILSAFTIYVNNMQLNKIVIYAVGGLILSFFGFIWNNIIDVHTKSDLLIINIQDYLENNLKNKLRNEGLRIQNDSVASENKEGMRLPIADKAPTAAGQANFEFLQGLGLKNEIIDNNLIEEILEEYLA